jgi:hypothetical protein
MREGQVKREGGSAELDTLASDLIERCYCNEKKYLEN